MTDELMEGLVEGITAILRAKDDFASLVEAAKLDPKADFKGADWSFVDFGTADLSGYDFSGANLNGADFSKARGLENAMFFNIIGGTKTIWPPDVEPIPPLADVITNFDEPLFAADREACSQLQRFRISSPITPPYADMMVQFIADACEQVPISWKEAAPWFKFQNLNEKKISEFIKGNCVTLEESLLICLVWRACAQKLKTDFNFFWRHVTIIPVLYRIEGVERIIYEDEYVHFEKDDPRLGYYDLLCGKPVSAHRASVIMNTLRRVGANSNKNYIVRLMK